MSVVQAPHSHLTTKAGQDQDKLVCEALLSTACLELMKQQGDNLRFAQVVQVTALHLVQLPLRLVMLQVAKLAIQTLGAISEVKANAWFPAELRVPKASRGPFNLFRGPLEFVRHALLETLHIVMAPTFTLR